MLTFVSIGENFLASTTAYIGLVMEDLWLLIALMCACFIGFAILRFIASFFLKGEREIDEILEEIREGREEIEEELENWDLDED